MSAGARSIEFAGTGIAALVVIQLATWLAWGQGGFPAIAAAGIIDDTGGDFAIGPDSCKELAASVRSICTELAGNKAVQENSARWERNGAARFLPGEPQMIAIEKLQSTPLFAEVQFGLHPSGRRLSYIWLFVFWVPTGREFTWIS